MTIFDNIKEEIDNMVEKQLLAHKKKLLAKSNKLKKEGCTKIADMTFYQDEYSYEIVTKIFPTCDFEYKIVDNYEDDDCYQDEKDNVYTECLFWLSKDLKSGTAAYIKYDYDDIGNDCIYEEYYLSKFKIARRGKTGTQFMCKDNDVDKDLFLNAYNNYVTDLILLSDVEI